MIDWMKSLDLGSLSDMRDIIEQEGLSDGVVPPRIFEEIDAAIELAKHQYVKKVDICIITSSRYGLISSPPFYKLTRDKSSLDFGGLFLAEECYVIYVRTQNQQNKYLKGIEKFYKNCYNTQILPSHIIHISW